MKIKSLIAASALFAAAVTSATAATSISLTQDIADASSYSGAIFGNAQTNEFTLDLSAFDTVTDLYASVTSNYAFTSGYNISNVTFDGVSFAALANPSSTKNGFDAWQYNLTGVTSAMHTIKVFGLSKDGVSGFSGTVGISNTPFTTVTAVPEPETYGMMLVGLGLMGAVARRRSKSNAA